MTVRAWLRQGLAFGGDVNDHVRAAVVVAAFNRRRNRDLAAVLRAQDAGVAGLTAAGRVEDSPVEDDAAHPVDREDGGLAAFLVGRVAEDRFRGGAAHFSSHSGKGRPFSFRKATLKIFEA